MDENTLRVLEFDKILRMAASYSVTVPGKLIVQKIKPFNNIDAVRHHSVIVSECRRILSEGYHFGIEAFDDLNDLLSKVVPADAVFQPVELRAFLPLFYSAISLRSLGGNPSCPSLGMMVSQLTTHPEIRDIINNSIDREGKIRDEASPELSHVRKSIKSCERKIRSTLEDILKQKDLIPHLQDFYTAERNNRWVVPLKRDSKGSIPGVVHDISNTGETVYVEPYSVQHNSNELESLRAEEKLEEYRILKRISSNFREQLHEIQEDYKIVARIDAMQAIAWFSEKMDMSSPEVSEKGYLKIIRGRHPLLWKTLRQANREGSIVPLDLEIGRKNKCMVITGSNAGGKTVALKSIGVLSLMALSGMHIPAGSGTVIPFLEKVFADIGDEQSIEQNLSTFSAHITRISEIISRSNANALILIDELGTGTDPEQGGALSCSVLRGLKKLGALTVVSTHLSMLKAFAHSEEGVINSAMEMLEVNVNGASSYRPTYKLLIGEPGLSHAFEIAESLGLPHDIIKDARQFIKGADVQVESLIADLKLRSREQNDKLKEIEGIKEEVVRLQSAAEEELAGIRSSKKDTLADALKEAEEIMRNAKREARDIISDLKKTRPADTGKVVKSIENKINEMNKIRKRIVPDDKKSLKDVREGQRVFINSFGTHGTVQSVNKKNRKCSVLVSGKEITMSVSGLSEAEGEADERNKDRDKRTVSSPVISEDINVEGEINVIGQRVDPALSIIERYLNDVAISGLNRVRIIHGIGEGILSRAIKDYLEGHPLVENSRKGTEEEGGVAVTVVFL
jgi:DNA mismatch repair protein MutS2